jgi:predicted ferric reductase
MMFKVTNQKEFETLEPTVPLGIALLILFAVAVGTIVAMLALETFLPAYFQSLFGPQREAFWDLARTSGMVAYLLMWLSVAFGLIITDRMAQLWPGGPQAFDLHQFTSLLGLVFAVFHAVILLGVQYIQYTPLQILIPFATTYQSLWVGIGQLAFYALIPITFTFYFRKQIGTALWRAIHYLSFVAFAMVTVHGLMAGSDTTNWVVLGMYALTGLSVMFLTVYRIVAMVDAAAPTRD